MAMCPLRAQEYNRKTSLKRTSNLKINLIFSVRIDSKQSILVY